MNRKKLSGKLFLARTSLMAPCLSISKNYLTQFILHSALFYCE
jgi:hypothetical protein